MMKELFNMHHAAAPFVIFSLRLQDGIPECVTHVVQLAETSEGTEIIYVGAKEGMEDTLVQKNLKNVQSAKTNLLDAKTIIEIKDLTVTGQKRILRDVSWTVKEGERWHLRGPNGKPVHLSLRGLAGSRYNLGSGKSTLLSMITGDHPQSYAHSITLFGKPRSAIATIKLAEFIGHASPEISNSFPRRHIPGALTAYDAIATGFESIFSYRKLNPSQTEQLQRLSNSFSLSRSWLDTLFAELSPADQSLALFLRAVVKSPRLLILDEPFSGMPEHMVTRCRQFIDEELDERQALIFVCRSGCQVRLRVRQLKCNLRSRILKKRFHSL